MGKITIKPFKKIPAGKIDINDYISKAGIDGLCVLEGHRDAEEVKNMRDNKVVKEWTGMCGITNAAIKEVKSRAKEAGITLPKEMMKITSAKQLGKANEDIAKMYAGYYAWVNDTKMNQLTDNAFSTYTPHQRDVMLSYLHNIDISQLSTGTKGSLIDAIKEHNEDEVIRRIFMKTDGSLADYEKLRQENKRGVANRWMATMQWWYDTDAEVVKDYNTRDKYYSEHYNRPGRMAEMLAQNAVLVEDTKKRKNEGIRASFGAENAMPENAAQTNTTEKPQQGQSFWERVYKNVMTMINPMSVFSNGDKDKVANQPQNILNNTNGEA